MTTGLCRECSRVVLWVALPDGNRVPLDMGARPYRVTFRDGTPSAEEADRAVARTGHDGFAVLHWDVCPKARAAAGRASLTPRVGRRAVSP